MLNFFRNLFSIDKSFKETQYLVGLRGYAALAVFFIHYEGGGLRSLVIDKSFLNSILNRVVDFGKYGVVVFFVLSAYTISKSLDFSASINYRNYLIRRLLRIIPMYYLIILVAFSYGGIAEYFSLFQVTNSSWNLLSHLSFLNLFQIEYRNNLIGVEWSVPIELFYYLLIPPLFISLKKIRGLGTHIFILSLSLALTLPAFINNIYTIMPHLSYHWSPIKYIFSFSFGLVLFHFEKLYKKHIPKFSGLILIELFVLLLSFVISFQKHEEEFITIWCGAIILVTSSRSNLSKLLFENPFIIYLGTVSYSFYLLHYPVLLFIKPLQLFPFFNFILGLVTTSLISCITYQFIEKYFMDLGRKLSR